MTEQELKRLSRIDLIEILLETSRENERLKESLAEAQKKLEDRTISVENTGSLAEAAMALNGIFEVAQATADQYLRNIQQREEAQIEACARMEQETREKCSQMILSASKRADAYVDLVNARLLELNASYFHKDDNAGESEKEGA